MSFIILKSSRSVTESFLGPEPFSHPILKGSVFVKLTDISKAAASRLLNYLVKGGTLAPVRKKIGRAGQNFIVLSVNLNSHVLACF